MATESETPSVHDPFDGDRFVSRFNVLGEFQATVNGRSILPSAAKPRQLLALMAMRPNNVLPVDLLIEELWGSEQPASFKTTLQTYVLQIRRKISEAMAPDSCHAKKILMTRYRGYVLRIPSEMTDAWQFQQLARAGLEHLYAGRIEVAATTLASARSSWRGDPLADVDAGVSLSMEISRLNETYRCVTEGWVEAELRRRNHLGVLGEIASLRIQDPLNEFFCGAQIAALYDLGRTSDALETFRVMSKRLDHELGVLPSPYLANLHGSILRGAPVNDQWARSKYFDRTGAAS